MNKFLIVSFYCTVLFFRVGAQIQPKENSKLNYRLIGFSFPAIQQTGNCKLEIAAGTYNSEDSFKRNIITTLNCKTNKIIAEVPSFGKQYTWRVITKGHSANQLNGTLHHFSTGIVPAVDTRVTRLRVLKKAVKYRDAYVFLDGTGVLYDMAGRPVWYLPNIGGYKTENSNLRDIKLSPYGTITFLYEQYGSYEINYDGAILWKAPDDGKVSGDNTEYYHHELTRLANGHYMILGGEHESWNQQLPSPTNSSYRFSHNNKMKPGSETGYVTVPFGTIIEYDGKGNVVWRWKSSEYFKGSDIYYHDINEGGIAPHENSFYFDEKRSIIYVGFRNISRILKIKYPEGSVLNTYGEIYKPGVPERGNGLFRSQHSVRYSGHGYLYLFDNNIGISAGDKQLLPSIIKLEEPASKNGPLKKIWEYQCTIDGVNPNHPPYQFLAGGNVIELPGRSLFANMSDLYSKVFILSPDKKILWSAIPERWNAAKNKWDMIYDYKASIVTDRKDLEKLIWNSEKNE